MFNHRDQVEQSATENSVNTSQVSDAEKLAKVCEMLNENFVGLTYNKAVTGKLRVVDTATQGNVISGTFNVLQAAHIKFINLLVQHNISYNTNIFENNSHNSVYNVSLGREEALKIYDEVISKSEQRMQQLAESSAFARNGL